MNIYLSFKYGSTWGFIEKNSNFRVTDTAQQQLSQTIQIKVTRGKTGPQELPAMVFWGKHKAPPANPGRCQTQQATGHSRQLLLSQHSCGWQRQTLLEQAVPEEMQQVQGRRVT